MKQRLLILLSCCALWAGPVVGAHADNEFMTVDEILYHEPDDTECATGVFADALAKSAENVSEDDSEQRIQEWIHKTLADPNVLTDVLNCPEFQSVDENTPIRFIPISYDFPDGREIVVNYETTPKILRQRIAIGTRRNTTDLNNANPAIGEENGDVWINTDPAWYGIMVVEHGALDNWVGPDKNNTLSIQYLNDHIDDFYPDAKHDGGTCTNRSAIQRDTHIINVAARKTISNNSDQDSNDYYVAGDINLAWIGYAEMALDAALTVGTAGLWAAITGGLKMLRGARVLKRLAPIMSKLSKSEHVMNYVKLNAKISERAEKIAELTKKYGDDVVQKFLKLKKETQAAQPVTRVKNTRIDREYEKVLGQMANIEKNQKNPHKNERYRKLKKKRIELEKQVKALDDLALDPNNTAARQTLKGAKKLVKDANLDVKQVIKNPQIIGDIQNIEKARMLSHMLSEFPELEKIAAEKFDADDMGKALKELEKHDDVKQYKEITNTYSEINKMRHALQMRKVAQRGNVVARAWHAFTAANTGNKTIIKGSQIARHGQKAGRTRDLLFELTLRHSGYLAQTTEYANLLLGTIKMIGGLMWDITETSTGKYTNNIQFKPLCLLSADDIPTGDADLINFGMWLMWQGDSTSAADDDAAYLQAMDFAQKFHQDLIEVQDAENNHPCNVDIYVVRPIIRNPQTDNEELYYLIMNDVPWTTNQD